MFGNTFFLGEVVDVFCGIGAISYGFKRAGFNVCAGYDIDVSCRYGYEKNNSAKFIKADIAEVTADDIKSQFSGEHPTVLVGCAPCQPFSAYRKGKKDERWSLLDKFADLALEVKTDFLTMENVAGLIKYRDGEVFRNFLSKLSTHYQCTFEIVDCSQFGVPQKRQRLVVIGSRTSKIKLETKNATANMTVSKAIGNLRPLASGEIDACDPLHRCSKLTEINLQRIHHSRPGGSWSDWPDNLVAQCHRNKKGKGYRGVYGRMEWDKPAPTITTQCYGYGNGRFGHPDQDRAISLREASLLQSFPPDYSFFPDDLFPGFTTVGRWIGNAVPVALAESIANRISAEIRNANV